MTVTLKNICKSYPQKQVLKNLSLTFAEKKIHALYGENGAGKSTLVNILAGSTQSDGGAIFLDEKEVHFSCPKDAAKCGIALVQQTPLLAPELSAWENLKLSQKCTASEAKKILTKFDSKFSLSEKVSHMTGNHKFYLALTRELLKNPKVLILDEPTAFLDAGERKTLYKNLRTLADGGANVIVITHSAAEASSYCDDVLALCDGELTDFTLQKNYTQKESRPAQNSDTGKECFVMEHVSLNPKGQEAILDADLKVNFGSISAVTGMQESSLKTLEQFVTGLYDDFSAKGTVFLYGKKINLAHKKLSARLLRKHNVAIVPSDKKYTASNPELTVEQMLYCAKKNAVQCIDEAKIKIEPGEKVSALSGGMLQRLILAREQSLGGTFYILCNPMQALDSKSQANLISTIMTLAANKNAILIVGAADIPLSLCTRVYSLEDGRCKLAFQKQD